MAVLVKRSGTIVVETARYTDPYLVTIRTCCFSMPHYNDLFARRPSDGIRVNRLRLRRVPRRGISNSRDGRKILPRNKMAPFRNRRLMFAMFYTKRRKKDFLLYILLLLISVIGGTREQRARNQHKMARMSIASILVYRHIPTV